MPHDSRQWKRWALCLVAVPMLFCAETGSSGSGLFQYGVWQSDDRILTVPFVDGVIAYFGWNVLEPKPGKIDLRPIHRIRSRVSKEGKRFIIRIVSAELTPEWIYHLGVPKVIDRTDEQPRWVPVYWNPVYLERLNSLIEKVAGQLDGDSSVAAVQIGIARYGEMCLEGRDWYAHGFSPTRWTDTCRAIIDVYRSNFRKTPLLVMIMSADLPGGRVTEPMKAVAKYAANHGIGLQFNGLSPDNSYLWGLLDRPDDDSAIGIFRRFAEKVPLSFEFTSDKVDPRLSCMNALSERASYLSVHTSFLESASLAPLFTFTRHFLGRTPRTSDAVWILLRQTFPDEPRETGKKNFEFGIEQVEVEDQEATGADGLTLRLRATTSAVNLSGLPARKTNGKKNSHHMVFRVSDDFDPGPDPVLTVVYGNVGEDSWYPRYMTKQGLVRGASIRKQNTGTWRQTQFTLQGFSRGSPVDLVIDSNEDGDEYIHYLQLTRGGSSVPLPFTGEDIRP